VIDLSTAHLTICCSAGFSRLYSDSVIAVNLLVWIFFCALSYSLVLIVSAKFGTASFSASVSTFFCSANSSGIKSANFCGSTDSLGVISHAPAPHAFSSHPSKSLNDHSFLNGLITDHCLGFIIFSVTFDTASATHVLSALGTSARSLLKSIFHSST